jgi:uncharacterized protein YdeI (YjbR/CyaY-like superfamily)
MSRDPRVAAYIAKAQPFARPVLKHLRKVVHAGCPEVEETMKWSFPHFQYKGLLDYMMTALKKNRKALATFEGFPPGQRREYIEWVTDAKTDDTRERRLNTALEWLAEGKIRNWKYAAK